MYSAHFQERRPAPVRKGGAKISFQVLREGKRGGRMCLLQATHDAKCFGKGLGGRICLLQASHGGVSPSPSSIVGGKA